MRIVEERGNREKRREGGEEKLSDGIVKKLLNEKRLKRVLWEKWNYIRRWDNIAVDPHAKNENQFKI